MPVELISQLILQRRLCSSIVVFEMGLHFRYEIRRVLAMELVYRESGLYVRHRDSSQPFPPIPDTDLQAPRSLNDLRDIALACTSHWENNWKNSVGPYIAPLASFLHHNRIPHYESLHIF
jgi:hypothetical protein